MRKLSSKALALTLFLLGVIAPRAAAESRLVFPSLAESTRLSVVNASDSPGEVVFRAISETGELIAAPGVSNPIRVPIVPHGQIARSVRDLFGFSSSTGMRGWIEATSAGLDGLKGSFQIGSGDRLSSGFEAVARPQKNLVVLPPRSADFSGGVLHVINTGQESARITIRLIGASGELSGEIRRTLPAAAKLRSTLDDLAPGLDGGSAAYLRVESTQEIAAWMAIDSGDRPMAVSGVASEAMPSLYGHFTLGPNMGAALRIASVSAEPTRLRAIFRGDDGQILSNPRPIEFGLVPGGVFEARLDSESIGSRSGPFSGWVEVVNVNLEESVAAVGSVSFGPFRDGALMAGSSLSLQSETATTHVLILPDAIRHAFGGGSEAKPGLRIPNSSETDAGGWTARLALHNPGSSEAEVSIVQRSQDGAIVASSSLTLGPGQYALHQLEGSGDESPESSRRAVELESSSEILGAYVGLSRSGATKLMRLQPVRLDEGSRRASLAVDFRVGDGSRHTGEAAVNLNANFTLVSVTGALKTPPCAAGGTYVVTAVFRNSSGTHFYTNISAEVVQLTGGNTLASQTFTLPALGIVGPGEQITGVFNITLATCRRFQFFINLLGDECAIPVNFRQMGAGTDTGGGTLHFDYRWDSSTGNLADLANCTVGERVDYRAADIPFPSPPFPAGLRPNNPTILNVAGVNGAAQDNHSTPGAFVKPYAAASVTATQIYRYTCTCANSGNPVTIMGPINIVRAVIMNANGSFRFEITKSGSSATINPLP